MADTKDGRDGSGGKAPPRKRPPQPSLVEGGWDEPAVEAEVEAAPPKKATTITGGTPLAAGAAGAPAEAAASASASPRAPGSNPSRGAPAKPEPPGATPAPGGASPAAVSAPPARPPQRTATTPAPAPARTVVGPTTKVVGGPPPKPNPPPRRPASPPPGALAPAGPPAPVIDKPVARGVPRPPQPEPPTPAWELRARADRLRESDPVGAARALVELGLYEERQNHDRAAARKHYDAARALVRAMQPAVTRVRRLLEGKADLGLAHRAVDEEIAAADGDAHRADLYAEKARLCEALGRPGDARAAYGEALALVPQHAASLRGLEAVLRKELVRSTDGSIAVPLAVHLERIADAYAPTEGRRDGDPRLAAWIHVERAEVLDGRLKQADLAAAALDRAVAFDATPGPVRDAQNRHLVLHSSSAALVSSLSLEAEHERDDDRASRLLYSAARVVMDKLQSPGDAVGILSRAAARAPARTPTERRVLGELIRLLEQAGQLAAAAEVRQKRLVLLTEAEAVAHEHVRLAEIYDTLGRADQAASHAQRALAQDPEDGATRERLDRALQRLGRHDERVSACLAEANAKRPTPARVAAFARAADIADRHLKRPDDAIAYLRAAWVIDPGNTEVFDGLSALLSPGAKDPETDPRGVRARIDLYTQAVAATREPARKIGLLEKLVSIWEDELCQPARAIEEIERILEIDPSRRTAILALQRNAERAGDNKQLARALSAEAALTTDPALQRRLLLRAGAILGERVGDRDRALAKLDKALALDPTDPEVLRALWRHHERAGRPDEARKALLALIAREPVSATAFSLWIEVALLDEHRLKRPVDAVAAYRSAARIKPRHPLPQLEIARLLRETGDYTKLVEVLTSLAGDATDPADYARLLFQAAEVQEFSLGNDQAAMKTLAQADSLVANVAEDFAILESMERIHVRHAAKAELVALYSRWLERHPPAVVDHGLRIALAGVLAETGQAKQAIELLQALVAVVPAHVPALRLLEQLQRGGAADGMAATLRAEADVYGSELARCGALWELVTLEEQVGPGATFDALQRIVADAPLDIAAHDAIIRLGGKLVEGVAIPHPAAIATRGRLLASIQARKELATDPVAKACYQLEEAMLHEAQAADESVGVRNALAGYRAALALWPESLIAARGLDRLAQRVGDRAALIASQLALSKLVDEPRLRAGHLVRAAELTADDPGTQQQQQALDLYEEALRTDPDSLPAAQALARMLASDVGRLLDRLGAALERATVTDQIVVLGSEIGRAVLRHKDKAAGSADIGIGVAAMRRVLAEAPDDVPSLLLTARLLSSQQLWPEARDVVLRVIEGATDPQARLGAQFDLAGIYEGPLGEPAAAQAVLESVLAADPKNRRALERLHQVAVARGDRALVMSILGRLAEGETDQATRAEYDLRLADACRDAGDNAGMVRALCDAVVSAPGDQRPWAGLARLYRADSPEGAAAYAKSLGQVIEIAGARRMPVDPRWLSTLGMLEATILKRPVEGVAHLQQAAAVQGAPPEARVALGQGLVAAGRTSEAVQVLRDLLTADAETLVRIADVAPPLQTLEAALATDGRAEERLAVEEVRACLGDVKPERLVALRARRVSQDVPYPMSLAGSEIARLLVPEARSPMIDVSVALAPVAAKALRFELSSLGVSSRDRIGARDGHPTRMLAERLARALGIEGFELYLTPSWQGAARVYPGDPPAIIGPTSFAELPEPEQAFALARLLTRMALGVTWLDELAPDAADGLLLATMRTIEPQFGSGEISNSREHAAQGFMAAVQKAIGRRQRKLLEEIAPTVSPIYDARAFTIGVRRSEYRVAYILSGDLVSAIDYLRRFDREIGRSAESPRVLLKHPVTNELLRFALTAEAYAERRRVGSV